MHPDSKQNILIIGAGVIGLSTGITLLQNGYQVTIWAKDLPPHTTSNQAAAVWYPYLCFPREKAIPWSKNTFEYLQNNILHDPTSGCMTRTMTQIFDKPQPEPWWKETIEQPIERPSAAELPEGYVDAYRLQTIVIDTSIYMTYLLTTFTRLGGTITQKEVKDLPETFQANRLVINCTGLGAKELVNDDKLYPVRGQMIKIKATGFDQVIVDDDSHNALTAIIPRTHDIMLAGTAQKNNWSTEIDPKDTAEILRKVTLIAPQLTNIEIISQQVGLRPAREVVRLEAETIANQTIIHNYGHGGAGFTLSWGCAQDVLKLIASL